MEGLTIKLYLWSVMVATVLLGTATVVGFVLEDRPMRWVLLMASLAMYFLTAVAAMVLYRSRRHSP